MSSTPLVAATLAAAVLIGFLSTLLESLKPAFGRRFGLAPESMPNLGRWLSVAWLPLMPLAGALVDLCGVHAVLFTASLLLAFGVAWLGVASSIQTLRWGVVGLALGGAGVTLAGLRLMPEAFQAGGGAPAGAFCIGFVFVALAALLTLYCYPTLTNRLGFRNTLLFTGLACLTPAAIASFVDPAIFPQGKADLGLDAAFANPRLWLLVLLILCWFPIEHSLDVWPRPFLGELGYSGRSITQLLAGFWVCFLLVRFGMAWVFHDGAELWLLFFLALIPPMVLGNLVGAYAPSSGYVGFWIIGGCYGPLLPAFLGVAWRRFPGQTVLLGVLLSVDALCALLIRPWFIRYLQRHTAREAMRIPLMFGLLLTAALLLLALI